MQHGAQPVTAILRRGWGEGGGAGQWLRYVVGALEVAGAAGLLIPRLAPLAALGLVALMAGATVTNVLILHTSPVLPLAFLVAAAVIAASLRKRTAK